MILFLLILVISFLFQLILPWWIIAPIAFICCFLKSQKAVSAFFISFLAIFLLWFTTAIILSVQNNHILSTRVGQMLGLGTSSFNWLLVAFLSSFLGALVAGFAGASGYFVKKLSSQKY